MLYALIVLSVVLSFISARSSYYPLKWAAAFSWWGLFVYWLGADLVADGSPTDVIFMLLFIMLGMLFMLWGVAGRKGTMDVEDEYSNTGSVIKRTSKYTAPRETKQSSSLTNSNNLEYRQVVRKSARGSGKVNRKRR